jgi:transposase
MSISEHKHMSEREPTRRIEVFTGAGRRRIWSVDQKAAIVAGACQDFRVWPELDFGQN